MFRAKDWLLPCVGASVAFASLGACEEVVGIEDTVVVAPTAGGVHGSGTEDAAAGDAGTDDEAARAGAAAQ